MGVEQKRGSQKIEARIQFKREKIKRPTRKEKCQGGKRGLFVKKAKEENPSMKERPQKASYVRGFSRGKEKLTKEKKIR